MAQFPFAKPKDVPTAEATEATEAAPEVEKKAKKVTKSGGERQAPAQAMTEEQVREIISLVKDMSYSEIATKVGVTKFQVNRVLMSTKKQLREAAEGNPAKLAKVEEYITNFLSRPEESRPGKGGGRGGKVKSALNDVVGDILNSLA